MKKQYILMLVIGILLIVIPLLLAVNEWYGAKQVYDEIDDSSIDTTLWTIASETSKSENTDFINVTRGIPTATATMTSILIPERDKLQNISLRIQLLVKGAFDNVDARTCGHSLIKVFGTNVLQITSTDPGAGAPCSSESDDSVIDIVRNYTGDNLFDVYNDGAFDEQVTAINNNLTLEAFYDPSTQMDYAGFLVYYVYYHYGEGNINISLLNPQNNSNQIDKNVLFNISTNLDVNQLKNISLYLNGIYNDTKTITGTSNNTFFNKILDYGGYRWNVVVCDSLNNCRTSYNSSVNISEVIFNDVTYNTTIYETSRQRFEVNLTYNSTLHSTTSTSLIYDGTSYSTTKVGSGNTVQFYKDITIPTIDSDTNKTFYWNFTFNGNSNLSDNYNQSTKQIYFNICNSTITTKFLNITFEDEVDSTPINASIPSSTFTYYLYDISVNKTYTYSNSSNSTGYNFCATPPDKSFYVVPYVQYKAGNDYPQRIWNPSVQTYTNATTNQTLYLLSSSSGLYVTLQVINTADQVISGVDVTSTRSISGSDVVVGTGTTGADGTITFWLNPDFEHTFTLSKTGFTTYTTSFTPTQNSYTITMSSGTTSTNSTIRGIDYSILPLSTTLFNDTEYSFEFNLTSSYWDVDSFGFNLRLANGSSVGSSSSSTTGTPATLNYNVNNQSIIYMDYYWVIQGNYTNATRYWSIINSDYTGWSIKTFFTDLNSYLNTEMFGIDNFGRSLIVFLILFLSVGIMSYKYGFTSPIAISTLVFAIIFFFDIVVDIIPEIRGIDNLLTYLSALVLVIVIFREVQT